MRSCCSCKIAPYTEMGQLGQFCRLHVASTLPPSQFPLPVHIFSKRINSPNLSMSPPHLANAALSLAPLCCCCCVVCSVGCWMFADFNSLSLPSYPRPSFRAACFLPNPFPSSLGSNVCVCMFGCMGVCWVKCWGENSQMHFHFVDVVSSLRCFFFFCTRHFVLSNLKH